MALVLKDRVKQTAAAPGTGTITLGSTPAGFQAFSAIGNGNVTYFAIVDPVSGAWEVNYGTYTSSGTTLTRNATPLSSSTGILVNFINAVDVFVTYPSENAVWRDTSGVVAQQSFGAITATSAALTSGTITTAPSGATDIVNKEYADSISSGLNYHQPVNYASTAALPTYTYNNGASGVGATITAVANGALSLGGGSPTATQRVLVKDEISANAPYNGIYVVTQAGTTLLPFILTRATDYDTSGTGTNEIDQGDYVLVISGTLASTAWVQQTPLPITVGTTSLVWLQFNAPITYYAGTGLNLSPATTFNITNVGSAGTYGSASQVPVFVTNASGQVTSVTNTSIAINGSAVSGNISGQAGSVANALTLGTYLTGTSFNGSAAVTATVDATSANTASKVVARDGSGNFSATTITAALSGNATTATTATNLAGGVANQLAYQSSANTTAFASAPSATGDLLNWNGSAFAWTQTPSITSITLSGGTANGVTYLNGSKVLTSGSALTFDGTNFATTGNITLSNNKGINSASTASQISIAGGTSSSASQGAAVYLSGNTNASTGQLYLQSGNVSGGDIIFAPRDTEGGRFTSTGLGIGTSSPANKLHVYTSSGVAGFQIQANAYSANYTLYAGAGGANAFGLYDNTASAYRYIVDSAGNLGIGTSSPSTLLTISGANTAARGQVTVIGASSADPRITLYRGSTLAGAISCTSSQMYIDAVEAVPLAFYTSDTQRAQFSAAGGFSVGTTADPGAGAIYATGNITAYYSSDIKFKENVRDIPDALATVNAIGGKLFDWKDDYIESKGGADGYFVQKADFGVVAQDVQKVFPIAVRTREDGSLAVDYEKLGALAFAALVELTKRVEALEAKG